MYRTVFLSAPYSPPYWYEFALYLVSVRYVGVREAMAEENWAKRVEIVRSMRAGLELLDDLPDRPNSTIICEKESYTTWLNETETIAEQIIDEEVERLKPRTWYERQDLHKTVANRIVVSLNNSTYKDE
ncbi:hypothetical protein AAVH_13326 [Aphelenchoides avenae]|nr:hypothetical protein AAVH_13326 [Aphelenchus avenae]